MVLPIPLTFVALVDGFTTTRIMLGSFTLDSLESLRFAVGVNAAKNHLDPTTYNPQHPLAPKPFNALGMECRIQIYCC